VQSPSQIITSNKLTPSFFYRPDALPENIQYLLISYSIESIDFIAPYSLTTTVKALVLVLAADMEFSLSDIKFLALYMYICGFWAPLPSLQ